MNWSIGWRRVLGIVSLALAAVGVFSTVEAQELPSFTKYLFPTEAYWDLRGTIHYDLEVADINRDGRPDLIVGSGGVNSDYHAEVATTVVFNHLAADEIEEGISEDFLLSLEFGIGTRCAAADFNGDGIADIATINSAGTSNSVTNVKVHVNRTPVGGDAIVFDAPLVLPYTPNGLMGSLLEIVVADFNLDGRPDIALGTQSPNAIVVYMNQTRKGSSNPAFSGPVQVGGTSYPYSMIAADFNGDGLPDIAATTNLGIDVLVNTGRRLSQIPAFAETVNLVTYSSSSQNFGAANLNGDARKDLMYFSYDSPYESKVGVATNTTRPRGSSPEFLQSVVWGNETFTPATIGGADINGDSKLDLIVTDAIGKVLAFMNQTASGAAQPSFSDPVEVTALSEVTRAAPVEADFDGDGANDLAFAPIGTSNLTILVNNRLP